MKKLMGVLVVLALMVQSAVIGEVFSKEASAGAKHGTGDRSSIVKTTFHDALAVLVVNDTVLFLMRNLLQASDICYTPGVLHSKILSREVKRPCLEYLDTINGLVDLSRQYIDLFDRATKGMDVQLYYTGLRSLNLTKARLAAEVKELKRKFDELSKFFKASEAVVKGEPK